MNARLAKIVAFPIKALEGVELQEARVLPVGSLEVDRRWAIVDAGGGFVNGKRYSAIHRIRAEYDLSSYRVVLSAPNAAPASFSLVDDATRIAAWLSDQLEMPCTLIESSQGGYPDDTAAPGPTVISTGTLSTLAAWFPEVGLEEFRRRFRANLEVGEVEPFWEDWLVGPGGREVPFQIGDLHLLGVNICQRCVVPSRDSRTGVAIHGFQKHFAEKRAASLPPWSEASRFDHFYRLAVNTRRANGLGPCSIRIGDAVTISEARATATL